MNFYDLNKIIEQSKVSEQVVRRPGFTPAGKPAVKPVTAGAKPAVKPVTAGAKPAVPGAKRPARIKFGKIPPTCPSFGCKEPEASPQKIVKDLKDLKPDQKKEVDKLVQSFTK